MLDFTRTTHDMSQPDRRDDAPWIRLLHAGHAQAFEWLVRTYGGRNADGGETLRG